MKVRENSRLFIILGVFFLLFLAVLVRIFYWQIIEGEQLRELGRQQSTQSLVSTAKRGDIFFSDKFPLATNKISYLLHANPKQVDSITKYADQLSPILQIDSATISAILDNPDLFWVNIRSRVEYDQKEEVDKLKLPGLGFEQESTRFYPEASLAAHLVGFVGKNQQGVDQGYFGLEGFYDRQLKGRPGEIYMVKDALGNPILTDVREEKKIDGRDLVLSIDRSVQFITDTELLSGINKYQAEGGVAIVMETETGKILAASAFPQFDPQNYYEFDGSSYKNPIISSVFEPGSTFKVLVMAAGIDKGLITATTKCDICAKPLEIDGYTIKTWNDEYHANSTMTDVLKHSDNTGMVFIARKLGLEGMLAYFDKFGIGELTGVDLQGEIAGGIRPKNSWYPIDLATASFGQGISVTPLQLISAVNSIANGGKLMKPMVVDKIITEDGKEIELPPVFERQTVSEKTAKIVNWMMVNTVEAGESQWTKIADYKIAGKTGTAQIPIEGRYDADSYNASFIGFFPADKPKITMLIVVNKPKTSIYGSETAAPIFFSIARDLIQYYNIPPSN